MSLSHKAFKSFQAYDNNRGNNLVKKKYNKIKIIYKFNKI